MFSPKAQTFEERVSAEAARQYNERESARMEIFRTSTTAQWRIQENLAHRNAVAAALKEAASVTKKIGKYETGKNYRAGNLVFKIYAPSDLTDKQKKAVRRMMGALDQDLSPANDFYPYIDLLFSLTRGEISHATFEKLTGLELNLSTWNEHHEHNW